MKLYKVALIACIAGYQFIPAKSEHHAKALFAKAVGKDISLVTIIH